MERRKRTATLLHTLAGLFLLLSVIKVYKNSENDNFFFTILILFAGAFSLLYGFFRKKIDVAAKYNQPLRILQFICFIVVAILLLNIEFFESVLFFAWAVIILVSFFSEKKVFRTTEVEVKQDGISIPGFFTDHLIPWQVLEKVVMRPDYLTIFRTNQKYVQLEVLKQVDFEEIDAINEFCRQQVDKNKPAITEVKSFE
ncbi:MAG: hypothetical protein ABR502_05210 [Chitinophagaceae bacterium]